MPHPDGTSVYGLCASYLLRVRWWGRRKVGHEWRLNFWHDLTFSLLNLDCFTFGSDHQPLTLSLTSITFHCPPHCIVFYLPLRVSRQAVGTAHHVSDGRLEGKRAEDWLHLWLPLFGCPGRSSPTSKLKDNSDGAGRGVVLGFPPEASGQVTGRVSRKDGNLRC